jgi:DNA-binding transcriptional LysR family regulator
MGAPELERLEPPGIVVERELWLVVHRDLRHTARVRAACDFVAELCAEEAALLAGQVSARRRSAAPRGR